MKISLQFLLILISIFSSAYIKAEELTVAVAANLRYVFEDLKLEFKNQSGHDVNAVFNSSGKIVTQVMHGAPFGLFMSADTAYPQALFEQKMATDKPQVYAYGALIIWTMNDIDIHQWKNLLKQPSKGKVAIANSKTSPYGKETMNFFKYYGFEKQLKSKTVYGDSIAQTSQYIYSRVVDYGITAKSVVFAKEMQGKGAWVELPPESYSKIKQGAVILNYGKIHSPKLSQKFYDFLFTHEARVIFKAHGYIVP